MQRPLPGMFAFGAAALSACGVEAKRVFLDTGPGTTGTGAPSSTWIGTGGASTTSTCDLCPPLVWNDDGGSPGAGYCGDSLDIHINDPLGETDWDLGLVDSSLGGWTGEDCLNGSGAYAHCHPVGPVDTLWQVADCQQGSVVAGETTWFDAERDPYLTYFLADSVGACFTWGADPAYYAALGCTEML